MKESELWSRVWRAVIEFDLIEEGDRVLIGLSGGKDSLFLCRAMAEIRKYSPRQFSLSAFTLDTRFAENFPLAALSSFCDSLDISFDSSELDVGKAIESTGSKDPCATCAYFRRGALNRIAREKGCNKLALAHHHDDAVETFLLSLFYSGRLHTFLPRTPQERAGITVIRPLAYFREREIITACSILKLNPIKNDCPYNGKTKRQEIKEMILEKETADPDFYHRMSSAMRLSKDTELWPPEPTRYQLRGKYLEFRKKQD
jgi:tRNA(Ile)-lysidine synthase TilS/MesJ